MPTNQAAVMSSDWGLGVTDGSVDSAFGAVKTTNNVVSILHTVRDLVNRQ